MTRSSSTEPAKPKRKATRSVSSLTPSQLARKRANDRETQRAIRTRTKEHIERLERGIKDLKSKQSGDHTVQELLRRNEALKEELMRIKTNTGVLMTLPPYSASVCGGNLSAGSDAIHTRGSPFPGDYNSLPDYSQQYAAILNNCGSRTSTVFCSVPSNVSSPSSSFNYCGADYIPTSVPTSILRTNNTSFSRIRAVCHKDVVNMEYDDIEHHDTIPQGLFLPDMRPNEEAGHTQFLDAEFRLSNPPL